MACSWGYSNSPGTPSVAERSGLCWSGTVQRLAHFANRRVHHGEQELIGIASGCGFDHLSHLPAGFGRLGQLQVTVLCRDRGQLRHHLEKGGLILSAQKPGLVHGRGEQLILCPVFSARRLAGRRTGSDGCAGLGM